MSSHRFRFSLLGMPRVVGVTDGESVELPLGKPLAALAYVTLAEGPVTREDLANLLWPSSPLDRGRASVRQAIWLLRKQIHPDVLIDTEGRLAVAPGVLTHDLVELGELISRGKLDAAWSLWNGGPLRGLAVSDAPAWETWADELRTRWERRFGEALETAAAGLPPEERLTWLDRALEVRPFRQTVHTSRVRTLIELRREEAAEEALHRLRSVVDEPDPELVRELEEALRGLKRHIVDAATDRLVPEFVGRSEELAELGTLWQSVLSARPRMVAIMGPAGIGKSRLAAELLRRASLDGAVVADAAGLDVERALELGVLATLVRDLLTLPGAAGISAGSIEALHTLLPSERRQGTPLHPATPAALSDALLDLLEAVSHEAPLVLLVEDVHWVDPASRTLLLRALRTLRGARVLIVWTCRTEEGDASTLHTIEGLERTHRAAVLHLSPLSLAEVREMVTLMVDSSSADSIERLARALHDTSNGNPLHAVELLQGLREEGVFVQEPGHGWLLVEERIPAALQLPPSVRQALERRLAHLSPEAFTLARELASHDRPQAPRTLMASSELSPAREADALHELLQRNVVHWTRDDRLDFAHSAIREAVGPPASVTSPKRRWLAYALATAAVLVIALVTQANHKSDAPPPFGGGTIWVVSGRTLHGYQVSPGTPVSLHELDSISLPAGFQGGHAPRQGPDGSRWVPGYTDLDPVEAPDAAILRNGRIRKVFSSDGDDAVRAFEPNLQAAVLSVQAPDTGRYHQTVARLNLRTGEVTTIATAEPSITASEWAWDGSLILAKIDAAWDTLVVLRPDGRRIASKASLDPDISTPTLCASRGVLAASLPRGGLSHSWYWNLATDEVVNVRSPTAMKGTMVCSPDGSAVAYLVDGPDGDQLEIKELQGAIVTTLDLPFPAMRVLWSPDPAPAPARVVVQTTDTVLARGARTRIAARVLDADGRDMDLPVEWSSNDPAIASVAGEGQIWANRAGTTVLRGAVYGWIRDSVRIRVTDNGTSRSILLSDSFPTLDESRWQILGYPAPQVVTDETDRPALDMRGDGRSADGIVSMRDFALGQGATLEANFRLPLYRVDRESIAVCLLQAEPGSQPEIFGTWERTEQWCAGWPARELADFDPDLVMLHEFGTDLGPVDAGAFLNQDDWNRFALQMRPDGRVSLFVNDRFLVSHPVRADNSADTRWRVLIVDRAADTRLFLRDVTLWNEARYPVPDVGIAPEAAPHADDDGQPGGEPRQP